MPDSVVQAIVWASVMTALRVFFRSSGTGLSMVNALLVNVAFVISIVTLIVRADLFEPRIWSECVPVVTTVSMVALYRLIPRLR